MDGDISSRVAEEWESIGKELRERGVGRDETSCVE